MLYKDFYKSFFCGILSIGDIMNELTKEEVLHVAYLARIGVSDEDIEKYRFQLKQIMNQIDKINEIKVDTDDLLITPTPNTNVYRSDVISEEIIDFKKNAPKTNGNYIEVKRFIND